MSIQKTITFYRLVVGEVKKPYNTKKQAEEAQNLLKEFGIASEIEKEKKVVDI